jgi:hypothetical protein
LVRLVNSILFGLFYLMDLFDTKIVKLFTYIQYGSFMASLVYSIEFYLYASFFEFSSMELMHVNIC